MAVRTLVIDVFGTIAHFGYGESKARMFRMYDSYLRVNGIKLKSGKKSLNESSEHGHASGINVRMKLLLIRRL
jgi:hypothetical protein